MIENHPEYHFTSGQLADYLDRVREAWRAAEVEPLRAALKPFAEIAKRMGWSELPNDAPARDDHVMEAPADDIAPGAFYVLHISDFANAAALNQQDGPPK